MPVIHYYEHAETGAVHGFTHPLHKEIAKQVKNGVLVKKADQSGTDPDVRIAELEAQLAALAKATGIDLSALGAAGLADTAAPGTEADDDPDADDQEEPSDEDEAAADEIEHVCLECGEPVERKNNKGPWPKKHDECK